MSTTARIPFNESLRLFWHHLVPIALLPTVSICVFSLIQNAWAFWLTLPLFYGCGFYAGLRATGAADSHDVSKSYGWLKQKYFSHEGQFGFFARRRSRTGETQVLRLHTPRRTVLERHVKVRGEVNPYDPDYTEYFEQRRCFAWRTLPLQKDWSTRPRRCNKGSGCLS